MQDDPHQPRSDFRWGIPASVVAHLLVAGLLVFGLPLELPTPPEEEAVTVEIVEPPEPEPPPAEEEPAEEEPAPEEPPPPPPPPPAEEDVGPEPPAPAEQSAEETAEAPPMPTLRPVIEFGEETTGPSVSPQGNSSEAAAEAREEPDDEQPAEPVEDAPTEAAEALAATPQPDAALSVPTTEPEIGGQTAVEEPAETLPEARTLFSPDITEDPVARTAMDGIPRGMRATQLCETELTEQLRNASPPQDPDFIPRSPLSEGTVLELRGTAFRAKGAWYDLSFRCEINEDATKVVSFGFRIGAPVPRSEWRQRGFPGS